MILGNAGIVSLIGTFLLSLRSDSVTAWITLAGILAGLILLYRIAVLTGMLPRVTQAIRRRLSRTELVELTLEEILHQQEGYGIARIIVPDCSPLIGLTLAEAEFPSRHILVLSLLREERLTPIPPPDTKLEAFDELVCYGRLQAIQSCLGVCDPTIPYRMVHSEHPAAEAAPSQPDGEELIDV